MFIEVEVIRAVVQMLQGKLADTRVRNDAGYSTEAVVVTALLVALAIAAVAIIAAKVLAKANSITTGG